MHEVIIEFKTYIAIKFFFFFRSAFAALSDFPFVDFGFFSFALKRKKGKVWWLWSNIEKLK